jgi:hypothetical protein
MRYLRSNKILIGGKSKNIGATNILQSKKVAPKTALPPTSVIILESILSNGSWKISASWSSPVSIPFFVNYIIEIQQIVDTFPTWLNSQSINTESYIYTLLTDGVYKVRVKAVYTFADSIWIESNIVNAFTNMSFNTFSVPSFHTLSFSHG